MPTLLLLMAADIAQNSFTYVELMGAGRLIAAALLGAFIGIERSLAGKHAGMRTYALVSLGSCLFIVIETAASYQLSYFSGVNPLQIAGSIVIGIGFIGTGLAVFRGEHPGELTTAAGIWVAAAVGMACGFGFYIFAIVGSILAILILSSLLTLENRARRRYGTPNSDSAN